MHPPNYPDRTHFGLYPSHYPTRSEAEIEKEIRESGMVDGVFHRMAAITPASFGGTLTKFYPHHRKFDDDYPVSWVEVRSGDFLEAIVSWTGDPVETLEISTNANIDFNFADRDKNWPNRRMNRLADADVPIGEALEQVLSWFPTHSEVKHGTIYDFNEISHWYSEKPEYRERVRFVKEYFPEVVTWEDYCAWVEEHITKDEATWF